MLADADRRPDAPGQLTTFVPGLEAIASGYDLVLCDVWGVLHVGVAAFADASEALVRFRSGGGRVVLLSNAPRPGAKVGEQLDALGVPRGAYDAIRTSGDLARDLVIGHGRQAFHHIGPERDLPMLEGVPGRAAPLAEAHYVVCTGLFDDRIETVADYEPALRAMRGRGLTMICANPDVVVERGDRLILCAGALAAAYEAMGGAVVVAGKPHRPVYESAVTLAESLGHEVRRERILAVGDALRTDIAGGHAFGIDTLMIARGIHAGELGVADGALDEATARAWLRDQPVAPTMLTTDLRWS